MCRDCRHWLRREAFEHHGRFSPCALKPDVIVKDRRVPGGQDRQAYVMSETYECGKYVREEDR